MASRLDASRDGWLAVEISPALSKHLHELARETGSSVEDVLRKAIALLDIALQEKKRSENGNIWVGPAPVVHEAGGTSIARSSTEARVTVSRSRGPGRIGEAASSPTDAASAGTEITGL